MPGARCSHNSSTEIEPSRIASVDKAVGTPTVVAIAEGPAGYGSPKHYAHQMLMLTVRELRIGNFGR